MKKHTVFLVLGALLLASGCTQGRSNCGRQCGVMDEQYVHKYGVAVEADDWQSRGRDGKVVTTLTNGVVVTKNYSRGELEGDATYTFPHSDTIEKLETFVQGNLVKEQQFDESGHLLQETDYLSQTDKKVQAWYESGAPKSLEIYTGDLINSAEYYSEEGEIEGRIDQGHGSRIHKNHRGELVLLDEVEMGHVVKQIAYFQNGTPKHATPFLNGRVQGKRRTYYEGGEPNTVEEWNENVQHGLTEVFRHGEKYAEVPYVRGKKHGIEKRYRDGDTLVEEITWEEDQKHGPSYTYVNGRLAKTEWFFKGRPVSKGTFDLKTSPRMG